MRWPGVLLVLVATAASADPAAIRPDDRLRLDGADAAVGRGLRAALSGGTAEDVRALTAALAGSARSPAETDLAGAWSYRMMKLGKISPIIVYPQFECHFSQLPDGYMFEKVNGSQRTTGLVSERDGRWIYLGTAFVAGQTPAAYADLPLPLTDTSGPVPDVGIVEQTGPHHARILFPAPILESEVNILDLTR